MAKLQGSFFGLATLALVVLASFYFTKPWLPALASDRGAIDGSLQVTLLVTGIVFIATNLLLAFVSWRYADRDGARAAYWHDNTRLEWIWTSATAVVMFAFLFGALGLWNRIVNAAPPKDAFLVEVTGQQFRWVVHYPGEDGLLGRTDPTLIDVESQNYIGLDRSAPGAADDLMEVGRMFVPLNRPVHLRIRSTDVIHSFFLPNFRVKQDAMPGMTIETWFTPTKPSPADPTPENPDFEIACAEHCGSNHFKMRGVLKVIPAASDAEFYAELRKQLE
jgi:cytochrome c oxidase subunit 2